MYCIIFFFKQKTAYEVRISDWSSDVCSSDLGRWRVAETLADAVAAIAHEAGQRAFTRWRTDFRRWDKSPGNPVCEVDLEIDALLRTRLSALHPDAGWLSEETVDNEDQIGRTSWRDRGGRDV